MIMLNMITKLYPLYDRRNYYELSVSMDNKKIKIAIVCNKEFPQLLDDYIKKLLYDLHNRSSELIRFNTIWSHVGGEFSIWGER